MGFIRDVLELPLMLHIGLTLSFLWVASLFHASSLFLFVGAAFFLYEANMIYIKRTQRELRQEERWFAYQKRPLSYSESVEWLNRVIKRIWPLFLERLLREFLALLIPYYLQKYKPWTAKQAILRHIELGKSPPVFSAANVVIQRGDDDHLILELKMDFYAAKDMSAILAIQMRRRLGFGIWTNVHISKLRVEGKVRVGLKFVKKLPFLSRIRICFETTPDMQMIVKPLSHRTLDVSDLPGVAGWMDKLVGLALEQSVVEPNMLVMDVEKLLSGIGSPHPDKGDWFHISQGHVAYVHLEILEAADLMLSSDANCKEVVKPYVKVAMSGYKFRTQKSAKTLAPQWMEKVHIPVESWDKSNFLVLHVKEKSRRGSNLGHCKININELRGGDAHEKWVGLDAYGRIRIIVKVLEHPSCCKDTVSEAYGMEVSSEDDSLLSVGMDDAMEDYEMESVGSTPGDSPPGELALVTTSRHSPFKGWYQRKIKGRHDKEASKKKKQGSEKDGSLGGSPRKTLTSSDSESCSEDSESGDEEGKGKGGLKKRRKWKWHTKSLQGKSKEKVSAFPNTSYSAELCDARKEGSEKNSGGVLVPIKTEHNYNKELLSPDSRTFSKRDEVKNKAKVLLKNAGKTAHDIGTTLWRKGSQKDGSHVSGSPLSEEGGLGDLSRDNQWSTTSLNDEPQPTREDGTVSPKEGKTSPNVSMSNPPTPRTSQTLDPSVHAMVLE